MENQPTPTAAAAFDRVQVGLLLCAVHALMESHPHAASFRESWAHVLSITHRDLLRPHLGDADALAAMNEAFDAAIPLWESYFPDSDAAHSKPQSP